MRALSHIGLGPMHVRQRTVRFAYYPSNSIPPCTGKEKSEVRPAGQSQYIRQRTWNDGAGAAKALLLLLPLLHSLASSSSFDRYRTLKAHSLRKTSQSHAQIADAMSGSSSQSAEPVPATRDLLDNEEALSTALLENVDWNFVSLAPSTSRMVLTLSLASETPFLAIEAGVTYDSDPVGNGMASGTRISECSAPAHHPLASNLKVRHTRTLLAELDGAFEYMASAASLLLGQ